MLISSRNSFPCSAQTHWHVMQIKQCAADDTVRLRAFLSLKTFVGEKKVTKRNIEEDVSYFPSILSRHNSFRILFFFHVFPYDAYSASPPFSFNAALFVALSDEGGNKGRERRERETRCAPSAQKPRGASSRVVMSSLHPFVAFHPFAGLCNCSNTTLSAAAPRKPRSSAAFTRINSTLLFANAVYTAFYLKFRNCTPSKCSKTKPSAQRRRETFY